MWDYPRPPRLEQDARRVRVVLGGEVIADTDRAYRVLRDQPPADLLPAARGLRRRGARPGRGLELLRVEGPGRLPRRDRRRAHGGAGGLVLPVPLARFAALADHVSLYPGRMDACVVGDERVEAQEGDFYGGWITPEVVGPFKGAPGTWGW